MSQYTPMTPTTTSGTYERSTMEQMTAERTPRQAMTALDIASLVIGTVGALNWGLSGAANYNLVRRLFGRGSILERAVYIVVGLAGLNLAWLTARYLISGGQTPLGPVSGRIAAEMQHPAVTQPPTTQPGAGTQPGMMR